MKISTKENKTMCYTIIRSFKATKEKLYFNLGDNNIVPHIWSDASEDATEENIKSLILLMLEGSYQPYKSIKLGVFYSEIANKYHFFKTTSCFEEDWRYNANRSYAFDKLFADTIGYMLFKESFYGEVVDPKEYKAAKDNLIVYEEESKRIYQEAAKQQEEKHIVHTHCAIYSDIFPNHDILIDDNECLIIAKRENYDNHGHLDNKDDSAIFLNGIESSSKHLYFLHDGSNFQYVDDEVYRKIESILLEKNIELYNQFHVLTLAKNPSYQEQDHLFEQSSNGVWYKQLSLFGD